MKKTILILAGSLIIVLISLILILYKEGIIGRVVDSPNKPIVFANYFITYGGIGEEIGKPLIYTPDDLSHKVGYKENDYWIAVTGSPDYLSYGPYKNLSWIRNKLGEINNKEYENIKFKIDFELMTKNKDFNDNYAGYVDIVGTSGNSFRTIYRHYFYPQDFKENDVFYNFTLTLPMGRGNLPAENEKLEFRVYWNANRRIALRNIYITPMNNTEIFRAWENLPWDGGLEPRSVYHYRIFNPDWILTSNFNRDGTVTQASQIEWWRRDINIGHKGNYPYIGPYGQEDPEVLRYHIRQAKAAGIDTFKISSYTTMKCGDSPDSIFNTMKWKSFETMLDIAAEENFGISLDQSGLETMKDSEYTYDDFVCFLEALANRGYFQHEGYFKINGKPVYHLPLVYETNPLNIVNFVAKLNNKYREITGGEGLYIMVTAMSTFSTGAQTFDGPYNLQVMWFSEYGPEFSNKYYECSRSYSNVNELVSYCKCKYDTSEDVSGYCVFLYTLLERSHMAGFRNMNGVDTLFDWTCNGAMMWPQYLYNDVWMGSAKDSVTRKAFQKYVFDAHQYGYDATISLVAGHDKRNVYKEEYVKSEGTPRFDDDGGIRFERVLKDAFDAGTNIINIENWNGWGESVNIEPSTDFKNQSGAKDSDIYLKLIAEQQGFSYEAPCIPESIIDPLRLDYIPSEKICFCGHEATCEDSVAWTDDFCNITSVRCQNNYNGKGPGDVTGEGIVNLLDLSIVSINFGKIEGDDGWNPNYDLNGDKKISIFDLIVIAINFGKDYR